MLSMKATACPKSPIGTAASEQRFWRLGRLLRGCEESFADDAGFCALKDRNRHGYQAHPGQQLQSLTISEGLPRSGHSRDAVVNAGFCHCWLGMEESILVHRRTKMHSDIEGMTT